MKNPWIVSALAGAVALAAAFGGGCCRRVPSSESPDQDAAPGPSEVLLDGQKVRAKWSDGDTFRILDGAHAKTGARLSGFNTLEDYGPVHRWGTWTPQELHALALAPEALLASRGWTCSSKGDKDKYNRLLVECPEVADVLVSEGLAMVFAVEGEPDPELLAAQRRAQEQGKGIWQKGVPQGVVTSVHSVDEGRGYNRVVDTRTGHSRVISHQNKYEVCEEVCEGPEGSASCMVYVPYERRYKNRPDCLQ